MSARLTGSLGPNQRMVCSIIALIVFGIQCSVFGITTVVLFPARKDTPTFRNRKEVWYRRRCRRVLAAWRNPESTGYRSGAIVRLREPGGREACSRVYVFLCRCLLCHTMPTSSLLRLSALYRTACRAAP